METSPDFNGVFLDKIKPVAKVKVDATVLLEEKIEIVLESASGEKKITGKIIETKICQKTGKLEFLKINISLDKLESVYVISLRESIKDAKRVFLKAESFILEVAIVRMHTPDFECKILSIEPLTASDALLFLLTDEWVKVAYSPPDNFGLFASELDAGEIMESVGSLWDFDETYIFLKKEKIYKTTKFWELSVISRKDILTLNLNKEAKKTSSFL